MKLRNLKSFLKRHYDINGIEKREKKIWKETTIINKFIALSIGWILIAGFITFIIYTLVYASDLNSVEFEGGYSITQKEYSCLVSGNSCSVCVQEDINGCTKAVEEMHSEK